VLDLEDEGSTVLAQLHSITSWATRIFLVLQSELLILHLI